MTKDEIIKLAKECGYWSGQTVEMNDVGLERFAALVAAAEREECAELADYGMLVPPDGGSPTEDECKVAKGIAAAIRARGEK